MPTSLHPERLFPSERAAALRRLADVLPRLPDQQRHRMIDPGPDRPANVSLLSPYVRHRVLAEEELVAAVTTLHQPATAAALVEGVFWRAYWKGWLELRPQVWDSYTKRLGSLFRTPDLEGAADSYERATEGRTGIDCFDAWCDELRETGYLHNRARRAFASIWTFTLGLPWELGADFMYRHLLDGDVAINTLSWRWVAGLQNGLAAQLVRRNEIYRQSAGRFNPDRLSKAHPPLGISRIPRPSNLPPADLAIGRRARVGLLLTLDDLGRESLRLPATVLAVAIAPELATDGPLALSPLVSNFRQGLLIDAGERCRAIDKVPVAALDDLSAESLADWARGFGINVVLLPQQPIGQYRSRLRQLRAELARAGIRLAVLRREWDRSLWEFAKAGFPELRRQIPLLIDTKAATSLAVTLAAAAAMLRDGIALYGAPESTSGRAGATGDAETAPAANYAPAPARPAAAKPRNGGAFAGGARPLSRAVLSANDAGRDVGFAASAAPAPKSQGAQRVVIVERRQRRRTVASKPSTQSPT